MGKGLCFTYCNSRVVYHYFMVSSANQPTGNVFQLLASLDEEVVAWRHLHWKPLTSVTSPDIESWITRTTVDGQEVEVRMEAGEDGILLAVLDKV